MGILYIQDAMAVLVEIKHHVNEIIFLVSNSSMIKRFDMDVGFC
jgi:hypothetical protein